MARSEIVVDNLSENTGTALTQTIVAGGYTGTNGYSFTTVKDSSRLKFIVENAGATGVFTIKAGDYCGNDLGDFTVVVGGGGIAKCIVVDGSRCRQNDASVYFDAGATGTVMAFQD
jgi:hypothetical protein